MASLAEKQMIFNEIMPHTYDLMVDVFGNYVIQKLFEHGAAEHRELLLKMITG